MTLGSPLRRHEAIDNLVGQTAVGSQPRDRQSPDVSGCARFRGLDPVANPMIEYDAPAPLVGMVDVDRAGRDARARRSCMRPGTVGRGSRCRCPWFQSLRVRRALGSPWRRPPSSSDGVHHRGPLVVPTGGRRPELGTNPLAFATRSRRDEVVVDMSISTAAMGKLELAQRSNGPIPSGWALDGAGEPLTEYPVPLLDGLLTTHLAGIEPTQRALNRLVDSVRRSSSLDPNEPVLVPGDPEREWEDRAGSHEVLVESACWRTPCGLLAGVRGAPVGSLPPPSTSNRGTR